MHASTWQMQMIRSGDNGKNQSLSQIDLFFFSVISSWNCNYEYLLGYQSILLGYASNIYTCVPSIGSWCVISLTQRVTYLWPPFPSAKDFRTKRVQLLYFSSYRAEIKLFRKRNGFPILLLSVFGYFMYIYFKNNLYIWQDDKFLIITIFKNT